ncbi:MAG: L-glutamate gamma-semialdehyde dehydrogenase [Clostridia bacterium]
MNNASSNIECPKNEPIFSYLPGSKEREALKRELNRQSTVEIEIPLIIGGKEVKTGRMGTVVMPHDHKHILARYHIAGEKELKMAVEAAMDAKHDWECMSFEDRASVFMRAAGLLSGPYRPVVAASTMLNQSKTVFQAEIDAPCELCDFLRFNTYFAQELFKEQPLSSPNVWNRVVQRPLDGFVLAVTPFNFTSIDGNLPCAPALIGNTVIWKPASSVVLSNYYVMRMLMDAGLPAGVINFVPSKGSDISRYVTSDSRMAGFHFTGSTAVFKDVWKQVGENIDTYESYPRLVGETGGKDFIFAHASADVAALAAAIVRGSFEFQGQKCSAASRAYIPQSIWETLKARIVVETKKLKMGDIMDFTNFMGAVIDENSFDNIMRYIDYAKASDEAKILVGGNGDKSVGYFIEPTIIVTTNPTFKTMTEEIFGPVMTIYVYDDSKLDEMLKICDESTQYALTGAIFACDRKILAHMADALAHAAGNFYINDKPTGAVVGQQPFGGGRASGTNDKAGSQANLRRWMSTRTIKETFIPSYDIEYPYMDEK